MEVRVGVSLVDMFNLVDERLNDARKLLSGSSQDDKTVVLGLRSDIDQIEDLFNNLAANTAFNFTWPTPRQNAVDVSGELDQLSLTLTDMKTQILDAYASNRRSLTSKFRGELTDAQLVQRGLRDPNAAIKDAARDLNALLGSVKKSMLRKYNVFGDLDSQKQMIMLRWMQVVQFLMVYAPEKEIAIEDYAFSKIWQNDQIAPIGWLDANVIAFVTALMGAAGTRVFTNKPILDGGAFGAATNWTAANYSADDRSLTVDTTVTTVAILSNLFNVSTGTDSWVTIMGCFTFYAADQLSGGDDIDIVVSVRDQNGITVATYNVSMSDVANGGGISETAFNLPVAMTAGVSYSVFLSLPVFNDDAVDARLKFMFDLDYSAPRALTSDSNITLYDDTTSALDVVGTWADCWQLFKLPRNADENGWAYSYMKGLANASAYQYYVSKIFDVQEATNVDLRAKYNGILGLALTNMQMVRFLSHPVNWVFRFYSIANRYVELYKEIQKDIRAYVEEEFASLT